MLDNTNKLVNNAFMAKKLILVDCGAPVWIKLSQFAAMIGEDRRTIQAWKDNGASDIVSIVQDASPDGQKPRYRVNLKDAVLFCLNKGIGVDIEKYCNEFEIEFDIDKWRKQNGFKKEDIEG